MKTIEEYQTLTDETRSRYEELWTLMNQDDHRGIYSWEDLDYFEKLEAEADAQVDYFYDMMEEDYCAYNELHDAANDYSSALLTLTGAIKESMMTPDELQSKHFDEMWTWNSNTETYDPSEVN